MQDCCLERLYMTQIIDRRLNGKNKSAVNRQRFIRRFKNQIKEAIENAISKRSITNIYSGERIIIPRKDINEPTFQHGQGGQREIVLPGNKDFLKGDKVKRSSKGTQDPSGASNEGEGTDNFGFEISKDEFLDLFFEDLELPDLVKTKLREIPNFKTVRAGYTTKGTPPNINIVRSFRNAVSRRIAFAGLYHKKLKAAQEMLDRYLNSNIDYIAEDIAKAKKEIEFYKRKIANIPFIDEFDIRYNYRVRIPSPALNAVMFCIMDVSGSMDEAKKEMAKRFFILLYLFLTKTYRKIDIVFIRHHTTAKEVDEQEFFYSRETGGTVVSSALEMMKKIINERYPTQDWNIYGAQASDGDNWNADSPLCQDILASGIMPFVQYYAYVEILPRHHQSLWRSYENIKEYYANFSMRSINSVKEIYPVFHELFKRH